MVSKVFLSSGDCGSDVESVSKDEGKSRQKTHPARNAFRRVSFGEDTTKHDNVRNPFDQSALFVERDD
jgi:hypothetical protein